MRVLARRAFEAVPALASTYRSFRDALPVRGEGIQTSFGFVFSGNEAMARGAFEPHETALVLELLADAEVVINCGANIGYYVCLALQKNRHVVAFEPAAENLKHLYKNLSDNGFSDFELYPLALSDKEGLLHLFGGGTGASLVPGWAGASESYRRTYPCVRLDTVIGDRFAGRRMLVIVDVEGGEEAVLGGASRLIRANPRPTWMIEMSAWRHAPDKEAAWSAMKRLFNEMGGAGYRCFTTDPSRAELKAPAISDALTNRRLAWESDNYLFR